jgi:hypothetical protein
VFEKGGREMLLYIPDLYYTLSYYKGSSLRCGDSQAFKLQNTFFWLLLFAPQACSFGTVVEILAICNVLRVARATADSVVELLTTSTLNILWARTRIHVLRVALIGIRRLDSTQLFDPSTDP